MRSHRQRQRSACQVSGDGEIHRAISMLSETYFCPACRDRLRNGRCLFCGTTPNSPIVVFTRVVEDEDTGNAEPPITVDEIREFLISC